MKHFVIFLVCMLAAYGLWHLTSPLMRREATRTVQRHGLRVLAIVLVLIALLVLAYFVPALRLI
ncbi:MAG: hypothetical protein E6Q34_08335 [Burkholderiaceae bacterium]|nr:MAG: hypothetical protein E6Q34_08335 [Burkholderiaceae bacterium]